MCDCGCSARIDAIEARLAAADRAVREGVAALLPKLEASSAAMRESLTRQSQQLAKMSERAAAMQQRLAP